MVGLSAASPGPGYSVVCVLLPGPVLLLSLFGVFLSVKENDSF